MRGLDRLFANKEIKSFASESWAQCWPMTLIMFFDFLIGITDIYVAGTIGKEIQATYGLVIQLYFVFIIIGNALTVGTVAVTSQLFSSGRREELAQAVHSTVVSAVFAGLIFGLAGVFLTPALIGILNIPEELKPTAIRLARLYAAGLPFTYILINSNGILRACKQVKTSLGTMALVCLLNLGLIFFFVFHTSLAYRGIALATVAATCAGSLVNLWHLKALTPGRKRFSLSVVGKLISIGWPSGLLQILWQLSSMAIYLILSALPEHRVEILAALASGLRVESAIFLPAFAFNMANAVIVGNLIGSVRRGDAYKGGMVTAVMGVCAVSILTLAVILNARWIMSFLSDNPLVVAESVKYIYVSMLSEPFMAWGIILGGGLNGAGDTRGVMVIVALSIWLVRIPLCYIFVVGLGFGALSVWWSMNISQLVMALLMTRRYMAGKWLERALTMEPSRSP
ncbi:MAG TPA: MATE family efflux transporter [Syntrophorhabdaceae bacterium]